MEFKTDNRYSVSVDKLIETFRNPEFLEKKYAALGHFDLKIMKNEAAGDEYHVTVCRMVPTDVPRFAKKILGETNKVTQREVWTVDSSGRHISAWEIDVEGAPISMAGKGVVSADGDGVRHEIAGKITCKIPLIGGKIAKFVSGDSIKAIDDEAAFTRKYLAG